MKSKIKKVCIKTQLGKSVLLGKSYTLRIKSCSFFFSLTYQVEVQVEAIDKAGNFIGWLFVDNTNLSVSLVEVKQTCILLTGHLTFPCQFGEFNDNGHEGD